MLTRIAFDQEFAQALRVRGLTLTELAVRAHVTVATASAAVQGRPLNVSTATRLARALASAPVVSELERWARAPANQQPARGRRATVALVAPAPTDHPHPSRHAAPGARADSYQLPLDVA
ncbi:MAG: helix-turn-helix transcriptional regulator [Candidatus Dormibacteraeota bacterium]|nr:helix-turn-helix transcriptional regulator [Candidatus Dormibacteraeota bacterium]